MATFYNQATLSYNGNVTSSNITTGEIREVLTAAKNAFIDRYSPNDNVVFVISIVNTGSTPFTNITVTDNLGAYTPSAEIGEVVPLTYVEDSAALYVNGVLQTAPTVAAEDPLTITGITVPADGNVMILYAARANQFAPLGADGSITNTAVISGTGFTDITVSDTITPATDADLAISKSLTPTEVEENGELTYTFIIQNYGNTPADSEDNVIFRDVFNPALTNITATFNGTVWTETTNYTYDETTGEFVTTSGQITVPEAEFTQNPDTGAWSVQPGVSVLVITGNIV